MESYDRHDAVSCITSLCFNETDPSDKIHQKICEKLSIGPDVLSLAQVLEAATWKGGREIAKEKRAGGGRKSLIGSVAKLTNSTDRHYQ